MWFLILLFIVDFLFLFLIVGIVFKIKGIHFVPNYFGGVMCWVMSSVSCYGWLVLFKIFFLNCFNSQLIL